MIEGTVTTPVMVEVIETARGQHQLIEVGRYAKCTCGVEFQWGADLYRTQYQEHREERIANASVAAALAAAEQRAADAEGKIAALREHTLESNPALRQLHDAAVAYVDAREALAEVRGGPLSTTLGYLIRAGYLVPASPSVTEVNENFRLIDRVKAAEQRADTAEAAIERVERVAEMFDNWEVPTGQYAATEIYAAIERVAALCDHADDLTGGKVPTESLRAALSSRPVQPEGKQR